MQNKDNNLGSSPVQILQEQFRGAEQFLELLAKQYYLTEHVVIRTYGHGAWYQLSGRDFCAHLGRAVGNWLKEFPLEKRTEKNTLVILGRSTYSTFVSTLGAVLSGLDVLNVPRQMSSADLKEFMNHFGACGLALDSENFSLDLENFHLPVIDISQAIWLPQDKTEEPPLLSLFRHYRALKTKNAAQAPLNEQTMTLKEEQTKSSVHKKTKKNKNKNKNKDEQNDSLQENHSKLLDENIPVVNEKWHGVRPGHFSFVSFGHDGFHQPEILKADALCVTAQNFALQVNVPKNIFWKSMECVNPSNPFAHLSRFVVMYKNGIIGFPNSSMDFETNMRILRPTFLFAGSLELQEISNCVEKSMKKMQFHPRLVVSQRLDKIRNLLQTGRAMKVPENIFDFSQKTLKKASQLIAGRELIKDAVEQLTFVVHGLSQASESHVRVLDKLGIPVIETYGTTHSAGMLSTNQYDSPHLNLIGNPLPHVSFRLGVHSVLEYKLSHPVFHHANQWVPSGDIAQMTPFGFKITGRKRHLVITLGGEVVSPGMIEKLIKDESSLITECCLIGHKRPFLSALLELSPQAYSDYEKLPENTFQKVQDVISRVNEKLPRNTTIKKFVILTSPFSEGMGELLNSGDVNRFRINDTRREEIAKIYS